MAAEDDSLRIFTGYNMKRAFNAIQADVNRTLAPFGLRMVTFSALSVIAAKAGLRQAQLADALSIERPNMVQIVDELEQAGLVRRSRARDDRRAYALHPTIEGRRLCTEATAAVRAHDARMTEGLTPAQVAALNEALRRIEANGEGSGAGHGRDVSGA